MKLTDHANAYNSLTNFEYEVNEMKRPETETVGLQVLHKHVIARDRKKAAKFREIENAIVCYTTLFMLQ